MSLVVQEGPEHRWNWRIAGTAPLLGPAPGRPDRTAAEK